MARIGIVALKKECGTSATDIPRILANAGLRRATDKTWDRAAAVKALMAAKNLPKMIGRRAEGKAGGTITNEEFDGVLSDDEMLDLGEGDGTHAKGNTFAANVSKSISAMTEAKTASELQRVRKLTLENDAREGRLISRDAVTATAKDAVTRARSALLTLGEKIAPMIAGLDDKIEIATVINSEIRHALSSLANANTFTTEILPEASQ